MRILVILNYYYPYISGVSEVARLVAESWAKDGHTVSVLTTKYESLPNREIINGVEVIRTPIIMKLSKGTISPQFIWQAITKSKKYDIIHLHLPMIESGLISSFIDKHKLFVTYQCDVNLPPNLLNNTIVRVMDFSNRICLKHAKKIAVTSLDYAMSSRIADKFSNKMIETAAPPNEYSRVLSGLKKTGKLIGFCGRIVEEKGIHILIQAFAELKKKDCSLSLVIGGEYKKIAGGSIYDDLIKYIKDHNLKDIKFIGSIPKEKMEEFYSKIDVLVLPSVNSLEAFGIVQVEAMLCGTPVVASDLPGVRTIVRNTGMGEIAQKGNPIDLAEKIEKVLSLPERYIKKREEIEQLYGTRVVIQKYKDAMLSIIE